MTGIEELVVGVRIALDGRELSVIMFSSSEDVKPACAPNSFRNGPRSRACQSARFQLTTSRTEPSRVPRYPISRLRFGVPIQTPPSSRRTRLISATAACASGMCSSAWNEKTRSNDSSGKGSCIASATTRSTLLPGFGVEPIHDVYADDLRLEHFPEDGRLGAVAAAYDQQSEFGPEPSTQDLGDDGELGVLVRALPGLVTAAHRSSVRKRPVAPSPTRPGSPRACIATTS